MAVFEISAAISYKKEIGDHEGLTLLRDLNSKASGKVVKDVSSSKVLHFTVEAKDKKEAEESVAQLCSRANLFRKEVETLQFVDTSNYKEARHMVKDGKWVWQFSKPA